MREVFVSYDHDDNKPNPEITHEVTDVIDHFLAVYRHVSDVPAAGEAGDLFFVDRTSIKAGESIPETVRRAIDECSVMLCFYSSRYFRSYPCLEEWKEFKRIQEIDRSKASNRALEAPKLLVPIEVRHVDTDKIEPIDERSAEWIAELTGPQGLKHNITSAILLDKDTAQLAGQLRALDEVIQSHILKRRGSTGGIRSASNILAISAKIEQDSLKTPAIQDELVAQSGQLKYDRLDPVCIIYAGGTVGMVQQADSDVLHADFRMASGVDEIVRYLRPRLSTLPFNMHFFSLLNPIDSSNVTASDWVNLATLVQEQMNNYQGFVILHGTNTLGYSASALSFLLNEAITKPVVFTGSEVPISVQNTDAVHNVENAIRATAWQAYNGPMRVPEVCVYWNNHLYRGNRVAKKYASDRTESFHTPNMPIPLATLANEKLNVDPAQIFVRSDPAESQGNVGRDIVNIAEPTVEVMFIHPDMDLEDLEKKYPSSLDGLILLSYGPGNVPEDARFIAMLKRLMTHGTIIGNVTQCPYGGVELKLFETSAALFDLGVVDAYDMTLEAAYTKLLWAIARRGRGKQPGVQESVRRTFQRSIAGEMSASIYEASFGSSDEFYKTSKGNYLISDVRRLDRLESRYDIAEVFVRLEGMRFEKGQSVEQVRLVFGRVAEDESSLASEENLLADFTKTLTESEIREGSFDKNLEITHAFRKMFSNDEFQVSIGVEGARRVAFSSLRLVVYARRARPT